MNKISVFRCQQSESLVASADRKVEIPPHRKVESREEPRIRARRVVKIIHGFGDGLPSHGKDVLRVTVGDGAANEAVGP
jgi:hypothetical protein